MLDSRTNHSSRLKTPKQWLLLLITVVKVLLNLAQITTCGLPQIKKTLPGPDI